jgi:hypothetical protein
MRAASPGEITIELFGLRVIVDTPLDALAAALAVRLPATSTSAPTRRPWRRYAVISRSGGAFAVMRGARKPALAASVDGAADLIVDDLQRTLAHRADGLVFVHAGAVAWNGRALVLPGPSGCGKSALVAALVREGAAYLSDEFAVFDGEGRVHPYARAIALRQPGGTRGWIPTSALDGRLAAGPVAPARIAFLRFAAGAVFRPRPVSPGQTVLGLLRHAVAARRRLALARAVLVPVARTVPAVRSLRGEAREVAARLLEDLVSAPHP